MAVPRGAAAAAAHTLLRSMPGVDPERTGVTGISWGGVLTCLAAGTDDRYGFAIPVYGCGFFNTPESGLGYDNPRLTPELRRRWFELWDPAHRLGNIACPTLFFSGSNDFAFPFDALRKSYRAVPARRQAAVGPARLSAQPYRVLERGDGVRLCRRVA